MCVIKSGAIVRSNRTINLEETMKILLKLKIKNEFFELICSNLSEIFSN